MQLRPHRQVTVDSLFGEVKVLEQQRHDEHGLPEGDHAPLQPRIALVGLVRRAELLHLVEELVKALSDQPKVPRDVVHDAAQAGDARHDNVPLVVRQYEPHGVLLQLRQEYLTRMPNERHGQLQRLGDVADDEEVSGRPRGHLTSTGKNHLVGSCKAKKQRT